MTIPDHIMARAAMAHAEFADSRVTDNLTDIIARAILDAVQEERGQIAREAQEWSDNYEEGYAETGAIVDHVLGAAFNRFAAAIRNRSVTEGE
jgi:hypothetical protein